MKGQIILTCIYSTGNTGWLSRRSCQRNSSPEVSSPGRRRDVPPSWRLPLGRGLRCFKHSRPCSEDSTGLWTCFFYWLKKKNHIATSRWECIVASTEHQNTCMTQLNIILECLWCLFVCFLFLVSFLPPMARTMFRCCREIYFYTCTADWHGLTLSIDQFLNVYRETYWRIKQSKLCAGIDLKLSVLLVTHIQL